MKPDEVRMRLLRRDDVPATNPLNLAFEFGLQDTRQGIDPGRREPDGTFVFDFVLKVRPGADRPVFGGPYASGPADDRFVYLSWRRMDGEGYINRVKARLGGIDWAMVRAAQAEDRPLTADMSGWTPHDHRRLVVWR